MQAWYPQPVLPRFPLPSLRDPTAAGAHPKPLEINWLHRSRLALHQRGVYTARDTAPGWP